MTKKTTFWLWSIFSEFRLWKSLKIHSQQAFVIILKRSVSKCQNLTPIVRKKVEKWPPQGLCRTQLICASTMQGQWLFFHVHSWGCLLNPCDTKGIRRLSCLLSEITVSRYMIIISQTSLWLLITRWFNWVNPRIELLLLPSDGLTLTEWRKSLVGVKGGYRILAIKNILMLGGFTSWY